MLFSRSWLDGDELHAHFVGALGQTAQDAFAIALLIKVLALGQHGVAQPRQLVGGGGHCLALAHP